MRRQDPRPLPLLRRGQRPCLLGGLRRPLLRGVRHLRRLLQLCRAVQARQVQQRSVLRKPLLRRAELRPGGRRRGRRGVRLHRVAGGAGGGARRGGRDRGRLGGRGRRR